MFLQQPIQLVQRFVDRLLPEGILLFGDGRLEGGWGPEWLREREDLCTEETGLEVDYGGSVAGHFTVWRLILVSRLNSRLWSETRREGPHT